MPATTATRTATAIMRAAMAVAITAAIILTPTAWAEGAAAAENSAKALEIFKKADEAASKVTSARFKATLTTSGLWAQFAGATEGECLMEGWDEELQKPRKFWSEITTQPPGASETTKLTGGSNGDTFYLIDHSTKKAYEDLDPAVQGTHGGTLLMVGFGSLMTPDPYEKDLASKSLELLGKEEVAGVECYQIKVEYENDPRNETSSVWSISTEDFLPRKRTRSFQFGPGNIGGVEITLHKLEVNPKIDPGLLTLKLPKGYEQIDDFAP